MKVIVSQEEVIEAIKAFYKLPETCDVEFAFTATTIEDEPVKQVKTRTRRTKLQILEDQQAQLQAKLQEQLQEELQEQETELETELETEIQAELETELQVLTEDDFLSSLDELQDAPKHQTGSKTDVDNELDSLFN